MFRVPVHKLEPGMVLARPIPLPADSKRDLLPRNQTLSPEWIPRLQQLGIRDVWIHCRGLEFLDELIDERLEERQREVYTHVRRNFESIMNGASAGLEVGQFQGAVSELFTCLKTSAGGNILLQKLDAFDNYLMSHSTNVCYLSLLLGMQLGDYLVQERRLKSSEEAKDLQLLGLGCLLHDVGKMRIASSVLNKPGALTPVERKVVEEHPVLGYEMVKGQLPLSAANIVLHHHQRFDGKGYPRRPNAEPNEPSGALAGRQIHIFSRIATVVDVFDAMTTNRCYSRAKLPVVALHELRVRCQAAFDPAVFEAFLSIVPPFPIGQVVKLNNGVEAAVVDFNPRQAHRPKVRGLRAPSGEPFRDPAREEIDLAQCDDLHIAEVDGRDVRPYQAVAEPVLS